MADRAHEPGVIIRPMRRDEGMRLRAIRLDAVADSPEAFGSTLEEIRGRSDAYWEGRAARDGAARDSVMFVAEHGEAWVGLAGAYPEPDNETAGVELISMWISPTHRGTGLGRRLVREVARWARERSTPRVTLWVTETNEPAVRLYIRCGFRFLAESQPLPSNPALSERRMILDPQIEV